MRVVAGALRGRAIDSPDGAITRPTTDRVRESMFSAVYSRLRDLSATSVLDAFAGSGALGIEALSRGACCCTFFERDARARRVLERNVARLGLSGEQARIVGGDVLKAAGGALEQAPFGLVLLDPPYALAPDEVGGLLERIAENEGLAPGAVIVYEHDCANSAQIDGRFGANGPFELAAMKRYGKIGVAFIRYRPQRQEG